MRMGSKNREEGEGNEHVIDMWEVDKERLGSMEENTAKCPKLLTKAAGNPSCCIFRVPHSFVESNRKAYQPQTVSIGPYHRGKSGLRMVQEHKWRYLGSLLSRTQTKGIGLEDLMKAIAPLESQARECYSETTIHLNSHEFHEMMVLDGCFIIELFRKFINLAPSEVSNDPFLSMRWILPFFRRDFLLLENQIPLFILHDLFQLSKLPEETSLSTLALHFFNVTFQRPQEAVDTAIFQSNVKGKHLLDLIRSTFIPSHGQTKPKESITMSQESVHKDKEKPPPTPMIPCVSKLRQAGIKITLDKKGDSFLKVRFRNGVIEMPRILVDDVMRYFLLNCVAFEQCYGSCSEHFTTYMTLLDCLINSYRDVEYLCEGNIIQNYLGREGDVAKLVNEAGKDVAINLDGVTCLNCSSMLTNITKMVGMCSGLVSSTSTLIRPGPLSLLSLPCYCYFSL